MKKPSDSPVVRLTSLRSWMLKNGVISATVDGISITLHPAAFDKKPSAPGELLQPEGADVELPKDLHDMSPMAMQFFSSPVGPPPEKEEHK